MGTVLIVGLVQVRGSRSGAGGKNGCQACATVMQFVYNKMRNQIRSCRPGAAAGYRLLNLLALALQQQLLLQSFVGSGASSQQEAAAGSVKRFVHTDGSCSMV